MNVFRKITTDAMKKNRMRTAVIIAGVVVCAAMITGVLLFAASLQTFLANSARATEGDWYMRTQPISSTKISTMMADNRVMELDTSESIGFAKLSGSKNNDKPYLYISGYSENMYDTAAINIVEGREARTSKELVVSEALYSDGGVRYRIGQKVKLEVGKRIAVRSFKSYTGGKVKAGAQIWPNTEYAGSAEEITDTKTRTYTVVGICEQPNIEEYGSPGYTAITTPDNRASSKYCAFVKTEDPKDIYDFTADLNPASGSYTYNNNLLTYLGASSGFDSMTILYLVTLLLLLIITIGSMLLFVNAFSIATADRARQFGALMSIGATGRQLRHSMLEEALMIGAAGIPPGILCGIGGIWVVKNIISSTASEVFIEGSALVRFGLTVRPAYLLIAAGLTLCMLLLSAFIPARKVSKLPPVDAMRGIFKEDSKKPRVGISGAARKMFGFEGALASRNFRLDRRRYRGAIISLVLSLVLFISAGSLISFLSKEADDIYSWTGDFDIMYTGVPLQSGSSKLAAASAVTSSVRYKVFTVRTKVPLKNFTKEARAALKENGLTKGKNANIYVSVAVMPDSAFSKYAKKAGYSESGNDGSSSVKVIAPKEIYIYSGNGSYTTGVDISNGSKRGHMRFTGDNGRKFDVGVYYTSASPMGGRSFDQTITVYMPESSGSSFFGSDYIKAAGNNGSEKIYMFFKTKDPATTYNSMKRICRAEGLSSAGLMNAQADYEGFKNLISMMKILMYGFITLLSLIAAANVFSTIATNILLRRHEFAMLQTVGMGPKNFVRMVCYSCIFYGMRALAYGLPIALLAMWGMYKILLYSTGTYMAFDLPWSCIIVSIISIIAVVVASILYSMHKLRKTGTMEGLRTAGF